MNPDLCRWHYTESASYLTFWFNRKPWTENEGEKKTIFFFLLSCFRCVGFFRLLPGQVVCRVYMLNSPLNTVRVNSQAPSLAPLRCLICSLPLSCLELSPSLAPAVPDLDSSHCWSCWESLPAPSQWDPGAVFTVYLSPKDITWQHHMIWHRMTTSHDNVTWHDMTLGHVFSAVGHTT